MKPLVPNLWCQSDVEEQVAFYVSLFDDSRVLSVQHYGPNTPGTEGDVMYVEFELLGQTYGAINGGPQFPYSEAISFEARCENQEQLDRIWAALADGGEPGPCGWIKDRWGLAWQITPEVLEQMMTGEDTEATQRATQYFLGLDKQPFDIAALVAAFEGR